MKDASETAGNPRLCWVSGSLWGNSQGGSFSEQANLGIPDRPMEARGSEIPASAFPFRPPGPVSCAAVARLTARPYIVHNRPLGSAFPATTLEPRPLTYKAAGVDIDAQNRALSGARDAIRSTFTPGVVGDVGLFGGLFDLERVGCGGQLMVASADGVGTKLEVASKAGRYDTVGQDLVNHCVNDVLVQGAKPLFFMDYVGTGRLEPQVVSELITGCATACRAHTMALLGGETAEMPGLYRPGDFDLVGFLVGSVAHDKLLDGSRVAPGQVLVGLGSSGLHTNGYSLARKIVFERAGLGLEDKPEALEGRSLGEALLAVHRSYYHLLWPLLEADRLVALAHITGGGLVDNLGRVLPGHHGAIDRGSWTVPALFRFLCETGEVPTQDAYQAFNMGIGMVLVVDESDLDAVRGHLREQGEEHWILGAVEAGEGPVRWTD